MRIVITTGPSYEPIDKVRRLSNFSSGELGTLLAEGFSEAGQQRGLFSRRCLDFSRPDVARGRNSFQDER